MLKKVLLQPREWLVGGLFSLVFFACFPRTLIKGGEAIYKACIIIKARLRQFVYSFLFLFFFPGVTAAITGGKTTGVGRARERHDFARGRGGGRMIGGTSLLAAPKPRTVFFLPAVHRVERMCLFSQTQTMTTMKKCFFKRNRNFSMSKYKEKIVLFRYLILFHPPCVFLRSMAISPSGASLPPLLLSLDSHRYLWPIITKPLCLRHIFPFPTYRTCVCTHASSFGWLSRFQSGKTFDLAFFPPDFVFTN